MDISTRLTELLAGEGWDAAELSRRSGVPYTSIRSILDGSTRNPRIDTIHKLALAFGLSIEEMMGLALPGGMYRLDADEGALLDAYRDLAEADRLVHWKAIMRAHVRAARD